MIPYSVRGLNFGMWTEPHVLRPDLFFGRCHPPSIAHVPGKTREHRTAATCVIGLLLPKVLFHRPVLELWEDVNYFLGLQFKVCSCERSSVACGGSRSVLLLV